MVSQNSAEHGVGRREEMQAQAMHPSEGQALFSQPRTSTEFVLLSL